MSAVYTAVQLYQEYCEGEACSPENTGHIIIINRWWEAIISLLLNMILKKKVTLV